MGLLGYVIYRKEFTGYELVGDYFDYKKLFLKKIEDLMTKMGRNSVQSYNKNLKGDKYLQVVIIMANSI